MLGRVLLILVLAFPVAQGTLAQGKAKTTVKIKAYISTFITDSQYSAVFDKISLDLYKWV